ncbi:hypothetical protein BJX68DRAFT_226329, partial [Aspergillus pseudodeflectus]
MESWEIGSVEVPWRDQNDQTHLANAFSLLQFLSILVNALMAFSQIPSPISRNPPRPHTYKTRHLSHLRCVRQGKNDWQGWGRTFP